MKKLISSIFLVLLLCLHVSSVFSESRTVMVHKNSISGEHVIINEQSSINIEVPESISDNRLVKILDNNRSVQIKIGEVCNRKLLFSFTDTEKTCTWKELYDFDPKDKSFTPNGLGTFGPAVKFDYQYVLLLACFVFFSLAYGIVLYIRHKKQSAGDEKKNVMIRRFYFISALIVLLLILGEGMSGAEAGHQNLGIVIMFIIVVISFFVSLLSFHKGEQSSVRRILFFSGIVFYPTFVATLTILHLFY